MKTITLEDGTICNLETTHEWNNLKVIEVKMPDNIHGMTVRWGEDSGEYRIFINERMSCQKKLEVFIHEMMHLYRKDFEKEEEHIQKIESECHQITQQVIKALASDF